MVSDKRSRRSIFRANPDKLLSIQQTRKRPLYFTALSPLVEIRPKDLTTNEDISVLLPYEDENQDGIIDGTDIPETEIHPGYYSEENSCWGPLEPLVPDPTANVAAMYTNHLDPFMLWGMSKDTTPNPKTQDSQKTSR